MRARLVVFLVAFVLLGAGLWKTIGQGAVESDLRSVPVVRADARVDRSVTEADIADLGRSVERSVAYVEELFEHRFTNKPKLVLFGSTESFNAGLAELFNYDAGNVTITSASYGGIFDRSTNTIAVNLQTLGTEDVAPTLEHEFTHYMLREITGGNALPAWFDEGVATLVERRGSGSRWPAEDELTGRAIAASGHIVLGQIDTLDGWHFMYPRFGQALYLYAANAASHVRDRVGWRGLLDVVSAVKTMSFTDAYGAAAGEPFTELEQRLERDHPAALITRALPSGDAQWTLYTGRPLTQEKVSIGSTRTTYVATFTVTTDDLGFYRGSFGSTAPPGTYAIGAAGARADMTTKR